MSVLLGAIADDFTGATDLANTLVKEGMSTVQVIGVPNAETDIGDAQAVVVALKSRTAPVAEAVAESLAALEWLRGRGAKQIFSKYCSTFDSTDRGNIGPIADALMDSLGAEFAFVCPAFPANGRTIYRGHLFVGDDLLSDSSMKDHPLTPMRDASLVRLMREQSRSEVGLIPFETVRDGCDAIRDTVASLSKGGARYGVVDALGEQDLRVIGQAAADHPLITGGSGVALGLPANFGISAAAVPQAPSVQGRPLVLAGSCSAATRAQIARIQGLWPCRKLDVDALAAGVGVAEAASWALAQPEGMPVVIYASADPEEVAQTQARFGVHEAGALVEHALGDLAIYLTEKGFSRLIVAGGETSGAVVSALNVKALRIGPEIAPGVPWTQALGGEPLALALKSGNFGGETFFEDAFGMLS